MFREFSVSVRGASHIRKDIPCEDFGLSENCEYGIIFITADGHGATECFRSNIGSEYICNIARDALKEFAASIAENGWQDELIHNPKKQEQLVRQLIGNIFSVWINAVDEQWKSNLITEDERLLAGKSLDDYLQGKKIEHIYGTTMIAGLMTKEYLLLLQQGDGRCAVFDVKGNVSQPIPWDNRCIANVTTSVCDEDAVESCRYIVIDLKSNPVLACFAGSDGVDDSYSSMEGMHNFYRNLISFAHEKGWEQFVEALKEDLPQLSEQGSKDDVTLSGFIDAERAGEVLSYMQRTKEITKLEGVVRKAEDKLSSMQRKMDALAERYKAAEADYLAYKEQYDQRVCEKEDAQVKLNELLHSSEVPSKNDSE